MSSTTATPGPDARGLWSITTRQPQPAQEYVTAFAIPSTDSPLSLRVFRTAETDVLGGEAGGDGGPLVDYAVRERALETAEIGRAHV